MAVIELTKGKLAVVDDDDFERVSALNWHAAVGGKYAATRPKHNGPVIYLHRFITGAPKGMDVDHVNGDTLDCRKQNLRICTHQQNMFNIKKKARATSRFIGVSFHRGAGKWMSVIRVDAKSIYLGLFEKEEDAARARDVAAKRIFGMFASLNFAEGA